MLVLLAAVMAGAASCSNPVDSNGYSFERVSTDGLRAGVTGKHVLLQELGSPSFKSYLQRDGEKERELWVYYSDKTRKKLFYKPEMLSRRIVSFEFVNGSDVVSKIEEYDLYDSNKVKINSHYTRVKKHKKPSLIAQILGNVGRVSSDSAE